MCDAYEAAPGGPFYAAKHLPDSLTLNVKLEQTWEQQHTESTHRKT